MSISKRMHLLYRIYCTIRLMNLNFEYSDGSQFAVLFPQCFTSMTCCSKPVIQSSRSFRVKFIFGSLKIHLRGKICLLSVSSVPVRPGIPNAEKQRSIPRTRGIPLRDIFLLTRDWCTKELELPVASTCFSPSRLREEKSLRRKGRTPSIVSRWLEKGVIYSDAGSAGD